MSIASIGRARLLLVDGEPQVRRVLRLALVARGFEVIEAESGAAALRLVVAEGPDLVLFDPDLPDMPGARALRGLRLESRAPIIFFATPGEEGAKLQALEDGADDFVTTPFGMPKLLTRLEAVLRAARGPTLRADFAAERVTIDLDRGDVSRDGRAVDVSPSEYAVLTRLMARAGCLVTRSALLPAVGGDSLGPDVRRLRAEIAGLRGKLELDAGRPKLISTVPGAGYRLRAPDAAAA